MRKFTELQVRKILKYYVPIRTSNRNSDYGIINPPQIRVVVDYHYAYNVGKCVIAFLIENDNGHNSYIVFWVDYQGKLDSLYEKFSARLATEEEAAKFEAENKDLIRSIYNRINNIKL